MLRNRNKASAAEGGNQMRKSLTKGLLIVILLLYSFSTLASAAVSISSLTFTLNTIPASNSLSGRIYASESGQPLQSGTVIVAEKSTAIQNGSYAVKDIPAGVHTIEISGPYRQQFKGAVKIEPGANQQDFMINPHFSQEEIDLLARITRAEAEGESELGKTAVAASILNRVQSERYPSTIAGVVYQRVNGRYQYSPVADGRINLPPRPTDYQAAFRALAGNDPSNGATGFFNSAKTRDRWVRSHPVTAVIDGHTFFKY
jgi:spore germination cell wall hydrolase CwlJ-like protein